MHYFPLEVLSKYNIIVNYCQQKCKYYRKFKECYPLCLNRLKFRDQIIFTHKQTVFAEYSTLHKFIIKRLIVSQNFGDEN